MFSIIIHFSLAICKQKFLIVFAKKAKECHEKQNFHFHFIKYRYKYIARECHLNYFFKHFFSYQYLHAVTLVPMRTARAADVKNLTSITWSHATNSQELLTSVLNCK
jgi:hypothetical protein